MKKPKLTRRQFLSRSALAGAGLCLGDASWFEPGHLKFETIEVPIRDLGRELDGYRIALFSDFHLPRKASLPLVREAVAMAHGFQPDVIAMPGDFTDHKQFGVPDFRPYFGDLHATDGVVGTLGNHDHWTGADEVRRRLAEGTPVQLVENRHLLVRRGESSLAIGGIGDLWEGVVDVAAAFHGVSRDVPRVLLSHNPDFAEDMLGSTRVDLQLSGHTHGGEIRVPVYGALTVPSRYGNKFSQGLCEGLRHRVYVTRGVCTLSHFRFGCRPEVTGITLRSA